jgi:hypothetical protein
MVEWENGETTMEPLQIIAKDDPVTCHYANDDGLLDTPGWKHFKSIAKRQKKFTSTVNQAKLRSHSTVTNFKSGYQVARNYAEAVRLDKRGNSKWQVAIDLELQQIYEYNTLVDLGHHTSAKMPQEYKMIRVHFVFDVKHNGRHKSR